MVEFITLIFMINAILSLLIVPLIDNKVWKRNLVMLSAVCTAVSLTFH